MTYSQFDPAAQNRVPWYFGAKIGPKRPFSQKQIWAIRFFLDREKRVRDRALPVLCASPIACCERSISLLSKIEFPVNRSQIPCSASREILPSGSIYH